MLCGWFGCRIEENAAPPQRQPRDFGKSKFPRFEGFEDSLTKFLQTGFLTITIKPYPRLDARGTYEGNQVIPSRDLVNRDSA